MTATAPWRGFVGALQFLTRIPVRGSAVGRAEIVVWFPVIGALLGAVIAVSAIGIEAAAGPFPAAATAVVVGIVLTGAFHEDGLADSADAVAGGATVERRQQILSDSRLGTYGTAAIAGSLTVRVAAVTTLVGVGWQATLAALVAVHAVARATAVTLIPAVAPAAPLPGVGSERLGAGFGRDVTVRRATATAAVAVAIGLAATGWWLAALVPVAAIAAATVGRIARRSFGGLSGDHLGAVEQLVEIVGLLVWCALATHHSVWWA